MYIRKIIHQDFLSMCREGIPIENRFATWIELAQLIESTLKTYNSFVSFAARNNLDFIKTELSKILVSGFDKEEFRR